MHPGWGYSSHAYILRPMKLPHTLQGRSVHNPVLNGTISLHKQPYCHELPSLDRADEAVQKHEMQVDAVEMEDAERHMACLLADRIGLHTHSTSTCFLLMSAPAAHESHGHRL